MPADKIQISCDPVWVTLLAFEIAATHVCAFRPAFVFAN